jgi:hypothetical protein
MVGGLVLLYIGLQMIDFLYHLQWKEFSIGIIFLSLLLTILLIIQSNVIGTMIWFVITLIEYFNYLKLIKK